MNTIGELVEQLEAEIFLSPLFQNMNLSRAVSYNTDTPPILHNMDETE